jgi:phage-related protein
VKSGSVPLTEFIDAGSTIRIEAVMLENRSCPATEFLGSLGVKGFARLEKIFKMFVKRKADGGHLSQEKFKQVEDTDFYEFRDADVRILCFFESGRLLLTHGFRKRGQRTPKRELERARSLKKVYEERRAIPHDD